MLVQFPAYERRPSSGWSSERHYRKRQFVAQSPLTGLNRTRQTREKPHGPRGSDDCRLLFSEEASQRARDPVVGCDSPHGLRGVRRLLLRRDEVDVIPDGIC
jgi:hypothetical protein